MRPIGVVEVGERRELTVRAVERWGWIDRNPAELVKLPPRKRAQLRPLSADEMARIVEHAFRTDDEWGLYAWLSAVTDACRGELLATDLTYDLENNVVELRGNYVCGLRVWS